MDPSRQDQAPSLSCWRIGVNIHGIHPAVKRVIYGEIWSLYTITRDIKLVPNYQKGFTIGGNVLEYVEPECLSCDSL